MDKVVKCAASREQFKHKHIKKVLIPRDDMCVKVLNHQKHVRQKWQGFIRVRKPLFSASTKDWEWNEIMFDVKLSELT